MVLGPNRRNVIDRSAKQATEDRLGSRDRDQTRLREKKWLANTRLLNFGSIKRNRSADPNI